MADKRSYSVFISYSSADAWTARKVESEIKDLGADTFLSENDVAGGDDFGTWMRVAMDAAQECVVLYTPEAASSRNVWIEIGGAWMARKRVVIILNRLTAKQVKSDETFPPYLKSIDFLDLNEDFDDKYLPQLAKRTGGFRDA